MKNINLLFAILTFIGLIILDSCDATTYQDIAPAVANPTYTLNIAPIMSAKCTSCHSNGDQSPNLETYDEVKDAVENGDVICRIDTQTCGDVMPQEGRMPQATIDEIKLWATNQFPN